MRSTSTTPTSTHQHINTSTPQHSNTSPTHKYQRLHPPNINTSTHKHLNTFQPQLIQLLLRDRRRRIDHRVAAGVVFGEGDEVADGIHAAKERTQPVEAECDAAVGWRPEFEGLHKEPELLLRIFRREAEFAEHQFLRRPVVDTDGSA